MSNDCWKFLKNMVLVIFGFGFGLQVFVKFILFSILNCDVIIWDYYGEGLFYIDNLFLLEDNKLVSDIEFGE